MASETHPSPSQMFRVTSGVHHGATFAPAEGLLLIGADTACDVCLSDAGLASRHAAIVSQASRVALRCLEGAVSVNGQQLVSPDSILLTTGADIVLGESGVHLHFTDAEKPAANRGPERTRDRRRLSRPAIEGFLVAAVAGIAVLAFTLGGRQSQASRPSATSAEATSARTENAAVSEAELVAQVQDVFRTSGYDVQISRVSQGELRVENLDANHERVRRAVERVKADVPQLKSLSFAPPGNTNPPEHAPLFARAGVDDMTVNVSGNTGYLVSGDGARYFVGSILPGGLTVRRITNEAVQIDRDGQISWYRF